MLPAGEDHAIPSPPDGHPLLALFCSVCGHSGIVIAAFAAVRRLLAFLGFLAVVVLALTLLYRVYLHHQAQPVGDDEPVVVELAAKFSSVLG